MKLEMDQNDNPVPTTASFWFLSVLLFKHRLQCYINGVHKTCDWRS